jgi:hypothetical protein
MARQTEVHPMAASDPSATQPPARGDVVAAAAAQRAGTQRLAAGPMLLLGVLFAIVGGAQIALAMFFLLRGHSAVVMPREQPGDALSVTIGGWLPLGAVGVVMMVLAWVMIRGRGSLRRREKGS